MAGLLRSLQEYLGNTVLRRGFDCPAKGALATGAGGPLFQTSTSSTTLEDNLAVIAKNAADVAAVQPEALAHIVAYGRAVQTANALLQKYAANVPTAPLEDVKRAAGLVGFRLPDAPR